MVSGQVTKHGPQAELAVENLAAQAAQLGCFEHLVAHIHRQARPTQEFRLLVELI